MKHSVAEDAGVLCRTAIDSRKDIIYLLENGLFPLEIPIIGPFFCDLEEEFSSGNVGYSSTGKKRVSNVARSPRPQDMYKWPMENKLVIPPIRIKPTLR